MTRGHVDEVSRLWISGWAWSPERPLDAVALRITADGQPLARVVANAFRPDLLAAGIGEGRHGFRLDVTRLLLPPGPVSIGVEVEATGLHLLHSPARLPAATELDAAQRLTLQALLDAPGAVDALRARAAFLAEQVGRLLARVADLQSSREARMDARQRKWRWRAEDGPEPPRLLPRALVIDSTMPAPGRDAGSHAVLSHAQALQRLGFEVTLLAADLSGVAEPPQGIAAIAAPWAGSVEEVLRLQADAFDLVYLHRVDVAFRYAALARHYQPRARLIYSVADLHSLRLQRQSEAEQRPELLPHANYVRMQELSAAIACHAVLTHSAAEAALLRHLLPQVEVGVVPWHMPARPTPAPFAEREGVLFVGSFGHAPNLDAALWLMDEIMPLVWQTAPDIPCIVAGTAMPAAVLRPRDARIRALGRVEDLDALFDTVRLSVAPLAYGAGLKGKVGDSLAAGVPCVCTPVAAEGFALPAPLDGLVAGDAAGLAAAIVRLHADPALFLAARAAGLAYIGAAFSAAAVDEGLRRVAGLPVLTPSGAPSEQPGALEAAEHAKRGGEADHHQHHDEIPPPQPHRTRQRTPRQRNQKA